MPSVSFVIPGTLSSKERASLREKNFELHCLRMRLEPFSEGGQSFYGPGVIRQTPEGSLSFTLYAQEAVLATEIIQEFFQGPSVPLGSIIPDEEFYRLSATDLNGREWISERIIPDKNFSDEGTVCTGYMTEIVYNLTMAHFPIVLCALALVH